jgi:UDP-arabinose 4-epimerase
MFARRWLHAPITFDNLSRGNLWAVKWGVLERGDIADADQLRLVLEKYKPGALTHFAAYAYVGESVERPLLYYQNNFVGTATLLRTVIDHQSVPVVFSSTCATYGLPERVPIAEDHPQRPINPYGSSKLFVERMLADVNVACGLPWMALRYFNAAGADPDGQIGEAHDPETHLIPLVLAAARSGRPVRIFGTDYNTPDGSCVRDYIHVTDIADAHVRALEYLLAGGRSCALNLANARGYSVKEVIAAAETVCGHPNTVGIRRTPRGRCASIDRRRQSCPRTPWLEATTIGFGDADCRCVEVDERAKLSHITPRASSGMRVCHTAACIASLD